MCWIRLPASDSVPFFQIRHWSYCTKLTRIWSGWPCQGLAKCIWSGSKPVCRNHWARFLLGYHWLANSFPLSDSVAIIHRRPGSYCAKPAWIRFSSGWLCQVLAKRIRSGSKPVCRNHPARFWPMLPSRSGPDANRIWHIYGDCLGQVNTDASQTLEGAVECWGNPNSLSINSKAARGRKKGKKETERQTKTRKPAHNRRQAGHSGAHKLLSIVSHGI